MMACCEFTIPGEPKAKGRPRFAVVAGHGRAYTDAKTASFENLVALCAANNAPPELLDGPLILEIDAIFSRPKKFTDRYKDGRLKNGASEAEMLHCSRPDADNIAKAILDGINQSACVWADDAQVATLIVSKRYAAIGASPETRVSVRQ